MDTSKVRDMVFAELLRIEMPKVTSQLDKTYTDGGIKAGERQKALAEMAVQAFADAEFCADKVWVWSENHPR